MNIEILFPIWIKIYGADHQTLAITLAAEIIALIIFSYFNAEHQKAQIKN